MKNIKKNVIRIFLTGLIWWALFYPDLYLVKDDCLVVECENCDDYDPAEDLLEQVCKARKEELVIKSRLLEWLRTR